MVVVEVVPFFPNLQERCRHKVRIASSSNRDGTSTKQKPLDYHKFFVAFFRQRSRTRAFTSSYSRHVLTVLYGHVKKCHRPLQPQHWLGGGGSRGGEGTFGGTLGLDEVLLEAL